MLSDTFETSHYIYQTLLTMNISETNNNTFLMPQCGITKKVLACVNIHLIFSIFNFYKVHTIAPPCSNYGCSLPKVIITCLPLFFHWILTPYLAYSPNKWQLMLKNWFADPTHSLKCILPILCLEFICREVCDVLCR